AFLTLTKAPADALIVTTDAFIGMRKSQIIELATSRKVPAIYPWREWTQFGGLMSYGADILDAFRIEGVYAGKVLNGAAPADLPVEQSVKFELAFNLNAAKALALHVPPTLLARADEVIECRRAHQPERHRPSRLLSKGTPIGGSSIRAL